MEKEFEFNQSIATLRRMDEAIRQFYEYFLENPDKSTGFALLPLAGEIRPLLKEDERAELDIKIKALRNADPFFIYGVYTWLMEKGHEKQVLFSKSEDFLQSLRR